MPRSLSAFPTVAGARRAAGPKDFPNPPGLLAHYPNLRETPSADPAERTEWNVRDADATLILTNASGIAASRGTALPYELAARCGKPLLVIDVDAPDAGERTEAWLAALLAAHTGEAPFKLGIGGPRERVRREGFMGRGGM